MNDNGVDIVYPFCKYFPSTSFFFFFSTSHFFVSSYTNVSGQKCNNWTEESRVKMPCGIFSSLDYFFFNWELKPDKRTIQRTNTQMLSPVLKMLYKEISLFYYSRHENKEKKSFLQDVFRLFVFCLVCRH